VADGSGPVRSIRHYLIIVLLASICLVNFLAALHGYTRSMSAGEALLDRQLDDYAHSLEVLVRELGAQLPPDLYADDRIFQVWEGDTLRAASANAPAALPGKRLSRGHHTVSYQGARWRLQASAAGSYQIIAGQRFDVYTHLIEDMIVRSILPIIWVLPLLGMLIWIVVSHGISPLRQLADLLQSRSAGNLLPVDETGYPAELSVVVAAINNLMQRVADAFSREQRFAADAAHELRTPLTALRLHLHNLQRELPDQHELLASLNLSVERMANSIEQMLALYRLTPEKFYGELQRVDLLPLLQQVIVDLYPACAAREQTIALDSSDPIQIEGDAFALQLLAKNLIDNASKYSPAGGAIHVAVRRCGAQVLLSVDDSGPGIPASDYRRVFDRFYRVGGDRHSSPVIGSGLGLSIVDHIVKLHRGTIRLDRSAGLGGLRVEVILPLQLSRPELSA
jgi:two-component system sensor histidine kinase QseC